MVLQILREKINEKTRLNQGNVENSTFRIMKNLTKVISFCYSFNMKRNRSIAVRHACGKDFTKAYRKILYENKLTFGARCLYFAILDLPPYTPIVWSRLARKLGTHSAQVNKWKDQIFSLKWTVVKE